MMHKGNEMYTSVFLRTTHPNMMQNVFVASATKFGSCLILIEPHRPITQDSKPHRFILKNTKAVKKSQMPLKNTAYGKRKTIALVSA